MKPAQAVQPDLFGPEIPVVQFVVTPKPQTAPQPQISRRRKKKGHRTRTGGSDRCEGSIQIPGLSHSRCDRCGEWIANSKF